MTAKPKKKAPETQAEPERRQYGPIPVADPERIRDISEAVYRERLGDGGKGMVEADGDGGKKLRARAYAYDGLTRAYLKVLKRIGDD